MLNRQFPLFLSENPKMRVYEYNSSSINEYLEEDFGSISSSPDEVFDCSEISLSSSITDNFGEISYSETIYPFGKIGVSKKQEAKTEKTSNEIERVIKIFETLVIMNNIKLYWVGFNIIFESNSSLVRKVVPDVSGG